RPNGFPHSAWELLEHVRLGQTDLADFMENRDYTAPVWPRDYWPASAEPPSAVAWDESIAAIHRDTERLRKLTLRPALDLSSKIPWGSGQTFLRTILIAVAHSSYHVGQLVAVRRLLDAWPDRA